MWILSSGWGGTQTPSSDSTSGRQRGSSYTSSSSSSSYSRDASQSSRGSIRSASSLSPSLSSKVAFSFLCLATRTFFNYWDQVLSLCRHLGIFIKLEFFFLPPDADCTLPGDSDCEPLFGGFSFPGVGFNPALAVYGFLFCSRQSTVSWRWLLACLSSL